MPVTEPELPVGVSMVEGLRHKFGAYPEQEVCADRGGCDGNWTSSRTVAATRAGWIPACHLDFVFPFGGSGSSQRCRVLRCHGANMPWCRPEKRMTQGLSRPAAKRDD